MVPALNSSRIAAYTGPRSDIFELVPPTALRVLDLGCSDGSLGRALKAARPERTVVGVEYSQALADRAAMVMDRVLQADLNRPDSLDALAGEPFDCVVCADVLEHLQQPAELLTRLHALLAPGAAIVVSLPNIRHVSALASIYLKGSFPRRPRGIFDDSHLRWFTLKDGRALLQEAGFAVDADMICTLRWGDQGGGKANKLLDKALGRVGHRIAPVREFLTYQFAMRGRLTDPSTLGSG